MNRKTRSTKTHHSAVVAIPPQEVWEPIQAIRRRYDRNLRRWMPHVTLLYPFWPHAAFDDAERGLAPVCSGLEPFVTTLRTLGYFGHGRGRFTLWFEPEPREPFLSLQAALVRCIPDCDDTSRFSGGFTPHLSVGQAGRDERDRRLAQIRADWEPLRFEVTEIALIHRAGDIPFVVDRTITLGQEEPCARHRLPERRE